MTMSLALILACDRFLLEEILIEEELGMKFALWYLKSINIIE